MRTLAVMLWTLASILLFPITVHAQDWRDEAGYLYLADRLDRPQDGYCIDVAGSGNWVDFTMPLNAHNCKRPGFYADEAVTFSSPGAIRFPAYGGCVTAVGLNGRTLPGAPLMIKHCADEVDIAQYPFVRASLQDFTHRTDGRIELTGTGLCFEVGADSDSTFSEDHRWRTLNLNTCEDIPESRSVWLEFERETE
ncbi:hypothetical protein PsW64_01549 [Pseudovibrio sp. W64]|uniref:RICIN domain-containing protein n=1 Tax=Pseudovibrio sp. W64 TaxID=1735583 RepID=UPI0007B2FA76|nr:RICIN domain-containing protein [Pseudovibrio sp. W64]KZK86296.1 hypothetical protein PsW64_01549 [Pseudovibrio sp. W64]